MNKIKTVIAIFIKADKYSSKEIKLSDTLIILIIYVNEYNYKGVCGRRVSHAFIDLKIKPWFIQDVIIPCVGLEPKYIDFFE